MIWVPTELLEELDGNDPADDHDVDGWDSELLAAARAIVAGDN